MSPVQYPVRTPPAYWFVVAALVLLGAVGGGLAVYALVQGYLSPVIVGLGGLLVVVAALYVWTTGEYRTRGIIQFAADHVDVPDARGNPQRFAAAGLQITTTRVQVRYLLAGLPVADVARGTVVELRSGGRKRRISTLTLVDREQGAALLADFAALVRGEAPRGPMPVAPLPPPQGPPDRLEQELERELAALD